MERLEERKGGREGNRGAVDVNGKLLVGHEDVEDAGEPLGAALDLEFLSAVSRFFARQ